MLPQVTEFAALFRGGRIELRDLGNGWAMAVWMTAGLPAVSQMMYLGGPL
jgi:hypothetical protein